MRFLYPKFWQTQNIIAYLLLPLSLIYAFFSFLRRLLISQVRLSPRVICVGNASIGGAGKTQIVIWLAKLLAARNVKFAIITRAYGSKLQGAKLVSPNHSASEVGDESVLLASYGIEKKKKKLKDATSLIKSLNVDYIIMDDGLQNPTFYKDFIILVVDAHRGFGNNFLLPAGPLRQNSKQALQLANAVIYVGNNFSEQRASDPKEFYAEIVQATTFDKSCKYLAFCGIGNPERFFETLKKLELNLVDTAVFPDHYEYKQDDLQELLLKAKALKAWLITTRKDYVKLKAMQGSESIICCDVELLIQNEEKLVELVLR